MYRTDIELIVDESVRLRLRSPSNEPKIYSLLQRNFEYLSKWIFWVTDTYDENALHTDTIDFLREYQEGSICIMDVFYGDTLIGAVDAHDIVYEDSAEIGYYIAESFSGKGMATIAAGRLMDFIRDQYGIRHFYIVVVEDNLGSIRVAENLGFHFDKRIYNKEQHLWEKRYIKDYL